MNSRTNEPHRSIPLMPFSLQIEVLDRMLNLEIADDPIYQGLEIQAFDDPNHGRGITVFLSRRADSKTDVHYQAGLNLDPKTYAIGSGLGTWVECEFEVARLAISAEGVDAEVEFTDVDGREIEVIVDLLHRTGDTPVIRIEGRQASAGRLPAGYERPHPDQLHVVLIASSSHQP